MLSGGRINTSLSCASVRGSDLAKIIDAVEGRLLNAGSKIDECKCAVVEQETIAADDVTGGA